MLHYTHPCKFNYKRNEEEYRKPQPSSGNFFFYPDRRLGSIVEKYSAVHSAGLVR